MDSIESIPHELELIKKLVNIHWPETVREGGLIQSFKAIDRLKVYLVKFVALVELLCEGLQGLMAGITWTKQVAKN